MNVQLLLCRNNLSVLKKKSYKFWGKMTELWMLRYQGRNLSSLRQKKAMQNEGRVTIVLIPRDIPGLNSSVIYAFQGK